MDVEVLETQHSDVVQDISYDYCGRRMATCSTDRTVKIWSSDPGTGKWRCTAHWQAHESSVVRVRWADPEYSPSLIATCGFDCKAVLWELKSQNGSRDEWQSTAVFLDSKSELNDLAFGPPHLGLCLATASNDGLVRIYESADPPEYKLWTLKAQFFGALIANPPARVTAISWNPSPVDSAGMVVATAEGSSYLWIQDRDRPSWRISKRLAGHTGTVLSISWAPNPGRGYHLIASSGTDGQVILYKVPTTLRPSQMTEVPFLEPLTVLEGHSGPVWRAEWNVSGTALATAGDDATRLWQSRAHDSSQWHCVGTVDPVSM